MLTTFIFHRSTNDPVAEKNEISTALIEKYPGICFCKTDQLQQLTNLEQNIN